MTELIPPKVAFHATIRFAAMAILREGGLTTAEFVGDCPRSAKPMDAPPSMHSVVRDKC